MSDLISRSKLLKEIETWGGCVEALHEYIKNMPTAYDIDNVVKELKQRSKEYNSGVRLHGKPEEMLTDDAIEIVKQGGARKDVEYMKAAGFVRRFDDLGRINIPKEIRKQIFGTKYTDGQQMEIFIDKDNVILRKFEESVSDDVCEWKSASDGEFIQNPHTKRLYSNEPSMKNIYCNTCGKKIMVVE